MRTGPAAPTRIQLASLGIRVFATTLVCRTGRSFRSTSTRKLLARRPLRSDWSPSGRRPELLHVGHLVALRGTAERQVARCTRRWHGLLLLRDRYCGRLIRGGSGRAGITQW